ncbi:BsaA family SipW-dependent biofilm matrix protein [Enterococcus rotai]|uniref:BsaA family SipW-dependent biofilm matrix protein n=1 Tax=Enterococcus rotai TaxID=118060 RepID=UPI0032B39515
MEITKKIINLLKKKWVVFLFTFVFIASAIALKETYAWFMSSDNHTNSFVGTELVAEIDEVFTPNKEWQPSSTTTKEIRIKNIGSTTTFVRISFYEFLASFQIDLTDQIGNGNLKTVTAAIMPNLDEANTDTWEIAAKNHGTYTSAGKNYITDEVLVSDPLNKVGMYEYNSAEREKTALKYLNLNFSKAFEATVPSVTEKKWLYEKGYFYYLSPLQSGELSEPLLDSVTLSDKLPNKYKGALYKLKVYMDAHDTTQSLIDEWQLEKNGEVYPLLVGQLK